MRFKPHLSLHAGIHHDTAVLVPLTDAIQIAGAALIVDDKGRDFLTEAFFEHEQSSDATVAIFKGADALKSDMEIKNLVKADKFLRFVLFDQGGHSCPDL